MPPKTSAFTDNAGTNRPQDREAAVHPRDSEREQGVLRPAPPPAGGEEPPVSRHSLGLEHPGEPECGAHLHGLPTRAKIKELHRYWFDTGYRSWSTWSTKAGSSRPGHYRRVEESHCIDADQNAPEAVPWKGLGRIWPMTRNRSGR